jgi:hypothetical protein
MRWWPFCVAMDSCAGYIGHPFKKEAHGDERSLSLQIA